LGGSIFVFIGGFGDKWSYLDRGRRRGDFRLVLKQQLSRSIGKQRSILQRQQAVANGKNQQT
jgi:hypothetical protein